MNISRLNYSQTLPLVQRAIRESHFLSFDLEMSGIMTEELTSPSIVDSMQIRYEKQKQSINKFVPLQFGMSAFRVVPHENKQIQRQARILVSPFNFFIFPLALNNDAMKFSFHAGTMNFLTKNNFDFNKLFYESVPYVSKDRLALFQKDEKSTEFKRQLRRTKQLQSPQSKAFLALNLPSVQQWLKTDQQIFEVDIRMIKYQSYMILKEKIEELHPESYLLFNFDNDLVYRRSKMMIKRCTAEEKIAQNSSLKAQNQPEELLFNKVVDEIVGAQKPLIVHNGFLDLMHVYYRFFSDLPQEWADYKQKLRKLFPVIYDNKYLFANSPTLFSYTEGRLTGLESCYLGMRKQEIKIKEKMDPPQMPIQLDPDFTQYSLDNLECHEAGFDSLMTGYSFLRGVTILNNDLTLLTNPKQFAAEHKLIRNRIPQGSIKVPFNMQDGGEDIYSKDGNSPIHFKSVLHQTAAQEQIQEYFSRTFGPINFLWTVRDMSEFCVIFLSQKDQNAFEEHLKKQSGASSSVLFEIGKIKYLVLSDMQNNLLMKNFVESEADQNKALESIQKIS